MATRNQQHGANRRNRTSLTSRRFAGEFGKKEVTLKKEPLDTDWYQELIHGITDPFVPMSDNDENVFSPNLPKANHDCWSYLAITLISRNFSAFAYLLELGADPNEVMEPNLGPMTVMDYLDMEYYCLKCTGDKLVLDGFGQLLSEYKAKRYSELSDADRDGSPPFGGTPTHH